MNSNITNKKDLVIEPLKLKHLIMLNIHDELNQFGKFQVLLFKKLISSIETNIIKTPERTPTCCN